MRETDPGDRRSARLYPTPAAVERLRRLAAARAALVGSSVARLDAADRAALAAALPALRRPAENLHEEAEGHD